MSNSFRSASKTSALMQNVRLVYVHAHICVSFMRLALATFVSPVVGVRVCVCFLVAVFTFEKIPISGGIDMTSYFVCECI